MGTNNKYTIEQRQAVSKIYDMAMRKRNLRRAWLLLDMRINMLEHKYGLKE